jgi:hypothetical protein
MSTAPDDVRNILNLPDKTASRRKLAAKTIIAFAHWGQRDAVFLWDHMFREILARRGEWPVALVRTARRGAL